MQIAHGAPETASGFELGVGIAPTITFGAFVNGTSIVNWRRKCAVGIEHLNAAIRAIGDVDVALRRRSRSSAGC